MIEEVLNRRNVMMAYRQVKRNDGSAGVDGMSAKELYAHLTKNRGQIETDIRKGKYIAQAIRGKELPKGNGKKRLLGIPTLALCALLLFLHGESKMSAKSFTNYSCQR